MDVLKFYFVDVAVTSSLLNSIRVVENYSGTLGIAALKTIDTYIFGFDC